MPRRYACCLTLLCLLVLSARAQTDPTPCTQVPAYGQLDFWVGEWTVTAEGRPVGTNRIEKILDGCAVLEHWTDAGGGEGKSLFYYDGAAWKQVWVTDRATAPGGLKEKRLVEVVEGGVRFQGTITLPGGGRYLDRTTLTALGDGRVRQVIETSTDDGATWQARFDAIYTPVVR